MLVIGIVCLIGSLLFKIFVKETKDKNSQEIEFMFNK